MSSHKKKRGAPVPPGNKSKAGPRMPASEETPNAGAQNPASGAPFEEQDPKRRLGNFEGKGEHALQQPGGKNDADR